MLKESFIASNPKEAYELAIKKYGSIDNFKVIEATQYREGDKLLSKIVIEVSEEVYNESIGFSEEEALIEEIKLLKSKMNRMREALLPEDRDRLTYSSPLLDSIEPAKDAHLTAEEEGLLSELAQLKSQMGLAEREDLSEKAPPQPPIKSSHNIKNPIATKEQLFTKDEVEKKEIEEEPKLEVEPSKTPLSKEKRRSDCYEEIDEVKRILMDKGLREHWLDKMLNPFVGTQVAKDKELLLSFIFEEIEEAILTSKSPIESRVSLFVGSTGVGKTTSLAKVAGFNIKKGLVKPTDIIFVNLDNFKIGAYEQLSFFAKALQVDYCHPKNPMELYSCIRKLENKRLILIDSAGSSPYDMNKILNTVEFLKDLEELTTYLVISTTLKYEDLMEIYNNFSFLNIKSLIITKFDETKMIGNIIAFLLDTKLPISFISNGQRVPDDIEVATKRKILDLFFNDIKSSFKE